MTEINEFLAQFGLQVKLSNEVEGFDAEFHRGVLAFVNGVPYNRRSANERAGYETARLAARTFVRGRAQAINDHNQISFDL